MAITELKYLTYYLKYSHIIMHSTLTEPIIVIIIRDVQAFKTPKIIQHMKLPFKVKLLQLPTYKVCNDVQKVAYAFQSWSLPQFKMVLLRQSIILYNLEESIWKKSRVQTVFFSCYIFLTLMFCLILIAL